MALSADKILSHSGVFKTTEVHVPAWADESGDDVVLVRGMTIREYEVVQANAAEGMSTASVLAKCIVDEAGSAIFSTKDIGPLAELPTAQVLIINKAITDESGLTESDAKNSESPTTTTGENDGSSSDSPPVSDEPSPS